MWGCEWLRLCRTEVGPASMIVGNLVAGKRIAQACGRDVAQLEDNDQARKVERFLHFPALPHAQWHVLLSSGPTCLWTGCPVSLFLKSLHLSSSLVVNKTFFFLRFSSCIYKTCCSGEHRPLQIILCLWFLTLRYCFVLCRFAFSKKCESDPDHKDNEG